MRWLLIDQILECEPGVRAVGKKTFPRSDLIFMDHFPGYPIVPGVLQIEMIAQMAGKCIAMSKPGILPVIGKVNGAKFYHHVHPGDMCRIEARVVKVSSQFAEGEGDIYVDDKKVSSASILFGIVNREKIQQENFDEVTKDWLARQKAKEGTP